MFSDDMIPNLSEMASDSTEETTGTTEQTVQETATTAVQEVPAEPPAVVENQGSAGFTKEELVSVSDIILQNTDKHDKMVCLNPIIAEKNNTVDLVNYIVYESCNTDKRIPCVYDCEKLYVPKNLVMDSNGAYTITSIQGRRSGFFITAGNNVELVMSKNFVYVVHTDENKNISEDVYLFSRLTKNTLVPEHYCSPNGCNCTFDDAKIHIATHKTWFPKFYTRVWNKKDITEIEQLRTELRNYYYNLNDINTMANLILLRCKVGC